MSEEVVQRTPRRWIKWTVRVFIWLFAAFILLTVLPYEAPMFFVPLLFGWVTYLREVLPRAAFNPEIAIEALVALALAVFGLHRSLLWWARQRHGSSAQWRLGWTIKITSAVLLLFAISIAATGIVHQVGWLFRGEPLIYDASRGRMTKEISNLKQVALGMRVFAEDFEGKCPADLDELVPDYVPTRELFYSSLSVNEPPERILFFPYAGKALPPDWIVLAGPRSTGKNKGKRPVSYADATAEIIFESEFQKRIAAQKSGAQIHRESLPNIEP